MTAEGIDRLNDVPAIARVNRHHPEDERKHRKKEKKQDKDESQARHDDRAVEDLIDHSLELLASDDEPVVLDEDIPDPDDHDLDLLL